MKSSQNGMKSVSEVVGVVAKTAE